MAEALLVRVAFPRGAYSGGELGTPEELPSPARVHAALLAAAAGGPFATAEGHLLVANERHRSAVRWLEEQEPLGIVAPATRLNTYCAQRYRLRAAPNHPHDTPFEPLCALDGSVTYAWPAPSRAVVEGLSELAPEVTHVGRADSTAIVEIELGTLELEAPDVLARLSGRGPGRALRVPTSGRLDALEAAYVEALARGRHGSGGAQAVDEQVEGAGERATALRRFARLPGNAPWPFAEAWRIPLEGQVPRWALRVDRRVTVAVAVHRAIVAAIGTDVPAFITGRDGDGPLRGAGHLAIHLTSESEDQCLEAVCALPVGVPEADRATLLDAVAARPTVRLGGRTVRLGTPRIGTAVPFWSRDTTELSTAVPMVLDTAGSPRRGRWTLEDGVICSVGYALRGVLEDDGVAWGTGWAFRQALVAELRARGVQARASRVAASASNFVHRAPPGDLLVAVGAVVTLGDLAPRGGGLLALGRARHLGGGLLRPVPENGP